MNYLAIELETDEYDRIFGVFDPEDMLHFHLGTYMPEHFERVDQGGQYMGWADGGYNEYLMPSTDYPLSLPHGQEVRQYRYVIVGITNGDLVAFNSYADILDDDQDCWDPIRQEWIKGREFLTRYNFRGDA